MEPIKDDQVTIFHAPPPEQRKSLVIKKESKIQYHNQIPQEINENEFLKSLIGESLPKNYNFEIRKTIWKIEQVNAKRVLLQLPEGLIRFGPVLVDVMSSYFRERGRNDVKFITMGDLTYGACCVDDYLANSSGCDLVIHYAHSCLVPINQMNTNLKYLYVFLDIKFDLEHAIKCIKHNFDPEKHHLALASTIQFVSSIHEIAKRLKQENFRVTLPQSRPLSSGEILGCTAPKLNEEVNTIVFVCDGRFHLEALMIANPSIPAYRYDPYSRKLTTESYNFDEMYQQRISAIDRAVETMKIGGTFGFILGTLGRQGNERVFDQLVQKLCESTSCTYVKLLLPEVMQETIDKIDSVDIWVQVACPRLSIDWGSQFERPLLNPYELIQSIKIHTQSKSTSEKSYPMDFYSKNSCGFHTPNHECQGNPSCECSK